MGLDHLTPEEQLYINELAVFLADYHEIDVEFVDDLVIRFGQLYLIRIVHIDEERPDIMSKLKDVIKKVAIKKKKTTKDDSHGEDH